MRILVLISLFVLVSCNGGGSGKSSSANAITDAPLASYWVNNDSMSLLPELDFTLLQIDYLNDYSSVLTCDGSYSSAAIIDGVSVDEIGIDGDIQIIQFGHLQHLGATDSRCMVLSGQRYTYEILGDTMELCNEDTSVCEIYTKQ